MKMKDEKQKHNHKLTDLIKVCIFGILMIAPLLASVSQMLYVTFNKNAKDSYSGSITTYDYIKTYEYQTNEVQSNDDLVVGNIYKIVNTNTLSGYKSNGFYNITRTDGDLIVELKKTIFDEHNYLTLASVNQIRNIVNDVNDVTYANLNIVGGYLIYQETNIDISSSLSISDFLGKEYVTQIEVESNTLDNAFYYGIDKMTKSDLFNWTQNTAIYNGVKAMTDNLQIQTPAIAILIVYWFILTIIYVIIDIVLKCFTTITHMIFRAD